MLRRTTLLTAVILTAVVAVPAQVGDIVGLTTGDKSKTNAKPFLNSQLILTPGSSVCPGTSCQPSLPLHTPGYLNKDNFAKPETWTGMYTGGAAYDGRHQGVWVSNGKKIALVDPKTCEFLCKPVVPPLPPYSKPPNGALGEWEKVINGLAFVESGKLDSNGQPAGGPGWLFIAWGGRQNWVSRVEVSQDSNGAWTFKAEHKTFVIAGSTNVTQGKIGGLAADDEGRYLILATSWFEPSTPPAPTKVHITSMDGDWSKPVCQMVFPILDPSTGQPLGKNNKICPNFPWGDGKNTDADITGLAYDSCTDRLFLTDGRLTVYGQLPISLNKTSNKVECGAPIAGGKKAFKIEGCCANNLAAAEKYTGLALLPKRRGNMGTSCSTKACNSCPNMAAGTRGDPILGNSAFGITLTGAPSNYTASALAIGLGTCSSTGLELGFCETVRVSTKPSPILLFFGPAKPATGTCGATALLPAPVPLDIALCKLEVSIQWLVECKGSPVGHAMTNCHSFRFSGN